MVPPQKKPPFGVLNKTINMFAHFWWDLYFKRIRITWIVLTDSLTAWWLMRVGLQLLICMCALKKCKESCIGMISLWPSLPLWALLFSLVVWVTGRSGCAFGAPKTKQCFLITTVWMSTLQCDLSIKFEHDEVQKYVDCHSLNAFVMIHVIFLLIWLR